MSFPLVGNPSKKQERLRTSHNDKIARNVYLLYEVALDNKYQDFMPFIKELREAKRKALIGRD